MEKRHSKMDIIKDIIFFFLTTAVSYGYTLLMLFIISFAANRYLHLNFEKMLLYSGVVSVGAALWYIVKMVLKYRRKNEG